MMEALSSTDDSDMTVVKKGRGLRTHNPEYTQITPLAIPHLVL